MLVGMSGKTKKRGPGRPKKEERPLSAQEKAQRRTAANKGKGTGKGFWRNALPCNTELCPLGEPCEAKLKNPALDTCVVNLTGSGNPEDGVFETYLEALQNEDPAILNDLTAHAMSAQFRILKECMSQPNLLHEKICLDAKGQPFVAEVKVNPAIELGVKHLAPNLGFTAKAQRLTPESRKDETVKGVDALQTLEENRRRLMEADLMEGDLLEEGVDPGMGLNMVDWSADGEAEP